jgi:hypothetical protein
MMECEKKKRSSIHSFLLTLIWSSRFVAESQKSFKSFRSAWMAFHYS